MDKNFKKAVLIFFISVLSFIAGVWTLDTFNRKMGADIDGIKEWVENIERIRNSPTEIIETTSSTESLPSLDTAPAVN
ncbi:hypothetical protein C4561_03800 [candidate division WWE3 bacterium]|jgi:hypothetical protein|uniref:Uncharacterized protein n=1 Tax=candidate division WWE3 bacterium TaxID=2053526 RepID=A0A3A4ZCI0_UNCKA|nr:MAG: hypothetical protein C4561_03800 [candidate division WWE3 bacterium]